MLPVMKPQKFRWSKVYESTEEELAGFLRARNITATTWTAEAFTASEPRTADQAITLWCAEGSLTVRVDSTPLPMQPGDGLRIPAGATFQTTAGMTGCICYESATATAQPGQLA